MKALLVAGLIIAVSAEPLVASAIGVAMCVIAVLNMEEWA